jgi:signal transduction histidine kinase
LGYPVERAFLPPSLEELRQGHMMFVPECGTELIRSITMSEAHSSAMRSLAPISLVAIPLKARGEQIVGTLGAATDLTSGRVLNRATVTVLEDFSARAAYAIENARAHELMQRAKQLREEVLAVVSHDLRNPLNAILMAATHLTRDAPLDESGTRMRLVAEAIHRAAARMNRLIDDLLDYASIEAGHLAVMRRPCSAEELLRDAAAQFESLALERRLALRVEAEDDLPMVQADRDRVLQVFANLLANAASVTPPGGEVALAAHPRGDDVEFVVSDTGPGIDPAELSRLFERYWRGSRPSYKGTGLGLSICKGIIDAHGGSISAENTSGSGATFRFVIPSAPPPR